MKTIIPILAAVLAAGTIVVSATAQGGTLDDVRKRGYLQCGTSTGLAGFSAPDDKGVWRGIDIDWCHALAAAVLGDRDKIKIKNLTGKTNYTSLRSGAIDILSRTATWTFSRDTDLQLTFVGTYFYDGQGFIVPADLGVKSAKELDGASVCATTGSTSELNVADFFRANNISYEPVPMESYTEARAAYLAKRCDAFSTDGSGLAVMRASMNDPSAHVILPEVISKEPLSLVVRQGDDQWADIARWTLNLVIAAEEMGITSRNVREMRDKATNPEIRRMLGADRLQGLESLGLGTDWAVNVIEQVGNYGEIYARNIGPGTPLNIERGLNRQWKDGGLIYSRPFR